jgi:hypothetical protein
MWASRAVMGSCVRSRLHACGVDWSIVPFGNPTVMGVLMTPVFV